MKIENVVIFCLSGCLCGVGDFYMGVKMTASWGKGGERNGISEFSPFTPVMP